MSQVPRSIVDTDQPCAQCGTLLKITFDEIGRPRHRCPQCHGVVTAPVDAGVVARVPVPAPGLATLPVHPEERARLAETVRPCLAPAASRRCIECGHALPMQATGRPRQRCADRRACRERAV